jgi:hypothetical protein
MAWKFRLSGLILANANPQGDRHGSPPTLSRGPQHVQIAVLICRWGPCARGVTEEEVASGATLPGATRQRCGRVPPDTSFQRRGRDSAALVPQLPVRRSSQGEGGSARIYPLIRRQPDPATGRTVNNLSAEALANEDQLIIALKLSPLLMPACRTSPKSARFGHREL